MNKFADETRQALSARILTRQELKIITGGLQNPYTCYVDKISGSICPDTITCTDSSSVDACQDSLDQWCEHYAPYSDCCNGVYCPGASQ